MTVRRLDEVWHVGTFDVADKGVDGPSYEGRGVSVSTCPDAWVRIAKLGGRPRWKLTREGGRFLDVHQLGVAERSAVVDWAKAHGFAADSDVYEVSFEDDEFGETMTVRYADRTEAEAEAEYYDVVVVERPLVVATPQLLELTGHPEARCVAAFDLAVPEYVEVETGLDGVWWADRLDVSRLSAPRGVIVASRLVRWQRTRDV